MNLILKTVVFLVLISGQAKAQCNILIPANTQIISGDTVIDCSFIPGHNFLVCSGVSLSMTGNSTCVNHFYLENAAVLTFSDSLPGAPYGLFSFYIKGIAILDFNDDSPVSFGVIDTLVYEPSALLVDTGSFFHYTNICQSVIFDYSQLPSGTPCALTAVAGMDLQSDCRISPVPFSDGIDIEVTNAKPPATIKIFDMFGKQVEGFDLQEGGLHHLKMKSTWNGAANIQVFQEGKVIARKMIARMH